jgi:putative ABC transport system permease protein
MALWLLALKNLWRNPRRTLVTGLAMATGFAGLSLFKGYVHRIERAVAMGAIYVNHTGHITIMKRNWLEYGLSKPKAYSLNVAEQTQIKTFLANYQEHFVYQTPIFVGIGLISNGCRSVPYYLKGLVPEFRQWILHSPEFRYWTTKGTRPMEGQDFAAFSESEAPLMVTPNLARLLNKKTLYSNPQSLPPATMVDCLSTAAKDNLAYDPSVQLMAKTFDGGLSAIDANLVGYFTLGFIFLEDMALLGPLTMVQKLYDTTAVSRWLVYLQNSDHVDYWQRSIRPEFSKKFPDLEMVFYNESRLNPFYVGTASFLNSLSVFFLVIVSIAIALAIVNSLTINIIERSKELGTFRALGFTESKLAWLLGREMVVLTALSLTWGILLTLALTYLINSTYITFEPPGATSPIKLEIALEADFQFVVFAALSLMVAGTSYLLARRRIRVKIADLLVET